MKVIDNSKGRHIMAQAYPGYMKKGLVWNESSVYKDPLTLRTVRRLTSVGVVNSVPTYHTAQSFTSDGKYMIFYTTRRGKTALCKVELESGDITCLIDPIDGLGGRSEIGIFGDGEGIDIGQALGAKTHVAYFVSRELIRSVNIDTLEERVLVEAPDEGMCFDSIALTADEKTLVYNLVKTKLEHKKDYHFITKRMDLASGEIRVVLDRTGVNGCHLMHNPTHPELIMIGMDHGPSIWDKADDNSRMWILNIDTGELINVKTKAQQNFQTHAAWSYDGEAVIYHGQLGLSQWRDGLNQDGWYIGKSGLDGECIREFAFPDAKYYGHIGALAGRDGIIIDNLLIENLLLFLDMSEDKPNIEIIGRHDSDFYTMPGQFGHPHPISDPTGKRIVFNSARREIWKSSRSDIYSIEL